MDNVQYCETTEGCLAACGGDKGYLFVRIQDKAGPYFLFGPAPSHDMNHWCQVDFPSYRRHWVKDEATFRAEVSLLALHDRQLEKLGRRSGSLLIGQTISTPWGAADHETVHSEGIVFYSTSSHGGFQLSPEKNEMVPASIRQKLGFYEEDCHWVFVVIAFPELFTDYEKRIAREICSRFYPDSAREYFS